MSLMKRGLFEMTHRWSIAALGSSDVAVCSQKANRGWNTFVTAPDVCEIRVHGKTQRESLVNAAGLMRRLARARK